MAKKQWQIDIDGKSYAIELEHNYLSGKKIITVNGNLIYNCREIFDIGGDYRFSVGDHICFVRIETDGSAFSYDLVVDGLSIDTKKPVKLNHQAKEKWERIKGIGRNKFLWYEGFFKRGILFAMSFILLITIIEYPKWNFDAFLQRVLLSPILMTFGLVINWTTWNSHERKFNK